MKNEYATIDKRNLSSRLQIAFGFIKEDADKLAHTLVINNINKNNGMVVRAEQALKTAEKPGVAHWIRRLN